MYELQYVRFIKKDLRKIPQKGLAKIVKKIQWLASDPHPDMSVKKARKIYTAYAKETAELSMRLKMTYW